MPANAPVLTTGQVTEKLNISRATLSKLVDTSVLHSEKSGATTLFIEDEVTELASRRPVAMPPRLGALVCRMGRPSHDGDRQIGWNETWPEEAKIEAVRGWWKVAWPDQLVGEALVAVVAGWVVGVWQIGQEPPERNDAGRVRFRLHPATPAQTDYFARRTLSLPAGPAALPIGVPFRGET
ncbi:hypothetical protein GCM10027169_22960 [Gordonia jinhuaensis]|uniref:Helix-turn-helix domain-containing protein n=1 Tax=Gordonia jinhuaensis TaxID=1517702 RepID=A0A916TE42_9ACTN|nr:hypothetical protein GCM10011489_31410 [Gordonia jinhuaensis]